MTTDHPLKRLATEALGMSQYWFPDTCEDLKHHTLGLCGEAGELANIVKKIDRGSVTLAEVREKLSEEAIDVLIYLLNIFAVLEIDPDAELAKKNNKNWERFGESRYPQL